MKFEEQFPSLKGKRISVPDCQKCSEGLAFLSPVIEEHCLDKQKFLDALDKLEKADNPYKRIADQMSKQITNAFFTKEEQKEYAIELKTDSETRISISELKKELGL